LSPKSRAGASKDEPPSSKKSAAAKSERTAAKARPGASKGKGSSANARAGDSPEDAQSDQQLDGSEAGRIRTLDFSQPTKFTTEIRRRISGAVEQFCEALARSVRRVAAE
jgi:hypothetical protein